MSRTLLCTFLVFCHWFDLIAQKSFRICIAEERLNLRSTSSDTSAVVGKLRCGDTLIVEESNSITNTIGNHHGRWVFVQKDDMSGYVFDYYLSEPLWCTWSGDAPPRCSFQGDDPSCHKVFEQYLIQRFGQLESPAVFYLNPHEGEGYHRIELIAINERYSLVYHVFQGAQVMELVMNGVNPKAGIQMMSDFFDDCLDVEWFVEKDVELSSILRRYRAFYPHGDSLVELEQWPNQLLVLRLIKP